MNAPLVEFLDPSFCFRLTETLLHFLWQGTAIGLALLILSWSLRRASAQIRYAASTFSLFLMALCVPVTFALITPPSLVNAPATTTTELLPATEPVDPLRAENGELKEMLDAALISQPVQQGGPASSETSFSDSSPGSFPSSVNEPLVLTESPQSQPELEHTGETEFEKWLRRFARYAACTYFVGVLLMLSRLVLAFWGGHRLRRCANPVRDRTLLLRIRRQAKRLGLKVVPVVAYCQRIAVPVVAGVLRPMILLPGWIVTGLDPEQLEAILAHEMAHIRRFDLLVNVLQRVVETVLFFHPAVWYVSRQIALERENCCDDAVVRAGYERLQYADALVRMAELCAPNLALSPPRSSRASQPTEAAGRT